MFGILSPMPAPPLRKISETIIDFGDPVISQLDTSQPLELVRAAFDVVILVWNSHVMAMPRWGQPKFLADLYQSLREPEAAPELVETVRTLSQRRQERFATDARAVGEWSVSVQQGQWKFRCDARAPNV